jgi:hypothetical protein
LSPARELSEVSGKCADCPAVITYRYNR